MSCFWSGHIVGLQDSGGSFIMLAFRGPGFCKGRIPPHLADDLGSLPSCWKNLQNSNLEMDNHHFQQVIIYQLAISLCHSSCPQGTQSPTTALWEGTTMPCQDLRGKRALIFSDTWRWCLPPLLSEICPSPRGNPTQWEMPLIQILQINVDHLETSDFPTMFRPACLEFRVYRLM